MSLKHKHCKPCEGDAKPLSKDASDELNLLIDQWTIEEDKSLEKTLVFKNFTEALAFINAVGKIAEKEDHHPDICLFDYKKVKLGLSTHAIGGLSENDFILAAKIDELKRASAA